MEQKERTGLIAYLYYNRDAKKITQLGDVVYHSKKHRYVQFYVFEEEKETLLAQLSKEKFIKKVIPCYIEELDTNFVGNLLKDSENVIM
ncbi:DUF2129 domain-containing protein [Streptococcus himalayensis]|uniref:UPF0298 protein n=1 Tax=Streptococcus himalayensis TaxID=1888195 RepID=A0A917AB00_9STRE|nr:DUF2129 domain-containing protein [Streptococcus himalayensis]GGE38116.1 UPF0298 protein [Streptococcus himalayensis]